MGLVIISLILAICCIIIANIFERIKHPMIAKLIRIIGFILALVFVIQQSIKIVYMLK